MLKHGAIVVLFALLGALAWVVPPHALGQIVDHYPETVWPWLGDGLWNVQLRVSVPLVFALGLVYGIVDPRYFWISFFATWWVCPLNIALDGSKFPTSHNLFPFELLIFAALNLPALAGGWIGRIVSQKVPPKSHTDTATNT